MTFANLEEESAVLYPGLGCCCRRQLGVRALLPCERGTHRFAVRRFCLAKPARKPALSRTDACTPVALSGLHLQRRASGIARFLPRSARIPAACKLVSQRHQRALVCMHCEPLAAAATDPGAAKNHSNRLTAQRGRGSRLTGAMLCLAGQPGMCAHHTRTAAPAAAGSLLNHSCSARHGSAERCRSRRQSGRSSVCPLCRARDSWQQAVLKTGTQRRSASSRRSTHDRCHGCNQCISHPTSRAWSQCKLALGPARLRPSASARR